MTTGSDDFEALARQYWGMWGDAMRNAGLPGSKPAIPGMRDAFDAWKGLAGGQGGVDQVLEHVARQGRDWYARMQDVAAGFAGQDHTANDVAQAWQQSLGLDTHAFRDLFRGMRGPGLQDLEQWTEAAAPWMQGLRGEAMANLGMPTFGFTREHQERVQVLGQAQLQWQEALANYNILMAKTSRDAFDRFETKLAEREEPGRQIGSVRALFDLWVDAAEEAYADTALSPEYRRVYGALVNAQMQLRSRVQAIAEQTATTLGMPSRTELDSAHRKIAELERQLRRLQRRADDDAAPKPAPASRPARKSARKPAKAAAPAAKRAPAKKPVRKAVKKPATKAAKPVKNSGKTAARKR